MAMILSHASRDVRPKGALSPIPALTTRKLIGPLAARASSKARAIASRSVTSQAIGLPSTIFAVRSSGSIRRPSNEIFAPAAWR